MHAKAVRGPRSFRPMSASSYITPQQPKIFAPRDVRLHRANLPLVIQYMSRRRLRKATSQSESFPIAGNILQESIEY